MRQSSGRSKGRILSSNLKDVAFGQGTSSRGGVVTLATQGRMSLPVTVGNLQYKPKPASYFSHEKLQRLQVRTGNSDNMMKIFGNFLRVEGGRKCVEPGLEGFLIERNSMLREQFKTVSLKQTVMVKKKSAVETTRGLKLILKRVAGRGNGGKRTALHLQPGVQVEASGQAVAGAQGLRIVLRKGGGVWGVEPGPTVVEHGQVEHSKIFEGQKRQRDEAGDTTGEWQVQKCRKSNKVALCGVKKKEDKEQVEVMKKAVVAKDIDSLAAKVMEERGLEPSSSLVQVGLDDGQGFIKAMLTVKLAEQEERTTSRQGRLFCNLELCFSSSTTFLLAICGNFDFLGIKQ